MRSAATLLLSLLPLTLTNSARLTFSDGGNYTISSNYDDTNIFVLNSTSLTLSPDAYAINAPSSTDDGESAIRVENAYLYVHGGKITGAANIGGSGVTVTTDKDRDSKSYATFEDGVEIIGGSAGRESTTKGGDAVQIIQQGAEATFNGGKFTPGTGCTLNVCGVKTDDGNALQVLYGKAIIKGGLFEGNIYSLSGDIEVHGCVKFDGETITGVLLNGNEIDVRFNGQPNDLQIVYDESVCKNDTPSEAADSSNAPLNSAFALFKLISVVGVLFYFPVS